NAFKRIQTQFGTAAQFSNVETEHMALGKTAVIINGGGVGAMRKRDVCSIEDARSGDARSVTVTVYRNLSDSQLVDEIKQCVGNIGLSRAQMNREMRMADVADTLFDFVHQLR